MAEDAPLAHLAQYKVSVEGTATIDGQVEHSTGVITINIQPSVGVYGDDMAVRNSGDYINLMFQRFGGDAAATTTVSFTVTWGSATKTDLNSTLGNYNDLIAGTIVIPADAWVVPMTLYAASRATDEAVVGIRTFTIKITGAIDSEQTAYIPANVYGSSLLGNINAANVRNALPVYILDGVTAFATDNRNPVLKDTDPYGLGINANDVIQGDLGDCAFMAALLLLARSNPQAIHNLITPNLNGSFTVKLYTGVGTVTESWTFSGNFLSNGWDMAHLSGDYDSNEASPTYGDVEIWPQLLEAAYAQLRGGAYGDTISRSAGPALVALTGLPYTTVSIAGLSNDDIAGAIQLASLTGSLTLGTAQQGPGKPPVALPPKNGKEQTIYWDHAYVVEAINTDSDGNVTSVTLLNPWGAPSKDDYEIIVPLADFSLLFNSITFSNMNF